MRIGQNVFAVKGSAEDGSEQWVVSQPEAIDKPEVLQGFYEAGEGEDEQGYWGRTQGSEGFDEAIDKGDHQPIAGQGADDAIV